jgi:hypothetical protein
VVGCYECDNDPEAFIKRRELLGQLSINRLLKNSDPLDYSKLSG